MKKFAVLCVPWAVLVWASSAGAEEFALPDDACVVFLGDVLTENGTFPEAVEAFVRVAYPQSKAHFFRIARAGASPESLRGFFEGDVLTLEPRPTHVVVCVGLHTVNMRTINEDELGRFRTALAALAARIKDQKMKVVLVTPPSADLNRNVRLKQLEFNTTTLGRIADVVREVASAQQLDLVDWYTVSLNEREKRQEEDSNFSFSRDGLRPQAEGNAMLAALLLEHWNAQPLRGSVTLDWAKAEASSESGSVSAERVGSDRIKLALEGVPIPWVLPTGRGERVSDQWYATRLCHLDLRAEGLPTPGLVVEGERRPFPLLQQQLADGYNLAASELMTQTPEAQRLVQLISVKNKLFTQRWVDQEAKRPADDELTEAYETLMKAYELYHAGYVRMIDQAPRRMNLYLTLRAVDPSDASATGRSRKLLTPRVTRKFSTEAGTGDAEEESPKPPQNEGVQRRIR